MMNENLKESLRGLMAREVAQSRTPGVSLLVLQKGEELFFDARGYADLERKIPLRRDHIFRLFSMTKPVTAVAAMILAERGQLDLNMPVSEVLPGFASPRVAAEDHTLPARRPVTVLHLLNMTSGLTYGEEDTPRGRQLQSYVDTCTQSLHTPGAVTTREFANALGQLPLAFEPDSSWCYGFSADVLGAVIEAVSGMRFGAFLEQNVFQPLNMNDTGFWVPDEAYSRLAAAYEPGEDGTLKRYTGDHLLISNKMDAPPRFESGGAGLVSTIDDYARFAGMLLNGGSLEGVRILSPRTVAYLTGGELTAPQQQAFRQFGGHEGYTYTHLLRRLVHPGQACLMSRQDEYGWAGWLGCYFANLPDTGTTILLMQQKKAAGTTSLTRRIRNLLSAEL